MPGELHTGLMCHALALHYDFDKQAGRLWMPEGECCDMAGCIDAFKKIDEGVKSIATFSGDRTDTTYVLFSKGWEAICAR
jgi:hypothetical protein